MLLAAMCAHQQRNAAAAGAVAAELAPAAAQSATVDWQKGMTDFRAAADDPAVAMRPLDISALGPSAFGDWDNSGPAELPGDGR